MAYDFTSLHPAYGTAAPMWKRLEKYSPGPDEICFGVAEMKFRLAPEISEAISKAAMEATFGYSGAPDSLLEAVKGWMGRRHGWQIENDWITQTYGLCSAMGSAIRALTRPGDGVLLNFPSYPPFYRTIERSGRRLVRSDLLCRDGRWELDLEDMERKLAGGGVQLLLFCSPHNPTGRVWAVDELSAVAGLCKKYDVPVISDEIHCDIAFEGHRHTVFASLSEDAAARTVTLTAPSKTFNIAGMTVSNVIIADPELRARVKATIELEMGGYINVLGFAACEAAYNEGEGWLEECLDVLRSNAGLFCSFVRERLPGFECAVPDGTYLAWLDCHGTGLEADAVRSLFLDEARFFAQDGRDFGEGYELFRRVNLACPRHYVEAALERLERAARARGII